MACKIKLWALLEIHHDSDLGPDDLDFEHTITIHLTKAEAEKARTRARRKVLDLPLSERYEVEQNEDDFIVFASDDWWKWEIKEVEVAIG